MSRRPLDDVLTFLRGDSAPPLAWAVEHSDGGRIDPVTAAWRASTEPYSILTVHLWLRHYPHRDFPLAELSAIAQAILAYGAWINDRDVQWRAAIADRLRRAVRLTVPEENALAVERGGIEQYLDAVESATMHMLGPRHNIADSQDVCAGLVVKVARAIAALTHRTESEVVPEICDAMRSAIVPEPTFAEMLSVIERRR